MSVEKLAHEAARVVELLEPHVAKLLKTRIIATGEKSEVSNRLVIARFPSLATAVECAKHPTSIGKLVCISDHAPEHFDTGSAGVPPLVDGDVAIGVYIDVDGIERPVGRVCVYGIRK